MRIQNLTTRGGPVLTGIAIALLFAACSTVTEQTERAATSAASAPALPPPAAAAEPEQEAIAGAPAAADTGSAATARGAAGAAGPIPTGSALPDSSGDTIVVTGSRIRRDDFAAAQATTVVTAEDMQALGVVSVADMINQLPENIATVSPEATADSPFYLGASIANLRGLNTANGVRTLTLIDSRRVTPTDDSGGVDLNFIPTALVGRIETVTGGASATYGADAMAGVVSLVLDDDGNPIVDDNGNVLVAVGDAESDAESDAAASDQGQTGQQGQQGQQGAQMSAAERAQRERLSAESQTGAARARAEAEERARVEAERQRIEADRQRIEAQLAAARLRAEAVEQQRQAAAEIARRFSQRSPLSRVRPGEEIWIIGKPDQAELTAAVAEDALGPGVMVARFLPAVVDDRPQTVTPTYREIPLPLKHTDVEAKIQGYVGTVDVTQEFENPYNEKIEAVYMFPLPDKAAISEFVMTIGERKIRGILREKQEAQVIYQQARAQGYQASLLTQHRPNVFEQKVANIEPGKQIDINIKYYETLDYSDGWYSFVFPTVVGPRYNPPGSSDPLVALPQTDFRTTSAAAVRYLTPGTRSAHDFGIQVELDAGVAIEEIVSSHELETSFGRDETVRVRLADGAVVPNADFRLDFRVAGDTIKSNLLTYMDEESGQGYFTLMMYPPADLEAIARQPLELVFVIDTSGSMNGEPIAQAKSAVLAALDRLEPSDTFQIIRFSQNASQFGPMPVAATAENIRAARRYVRELAGGGGTQMIEGIKAALDFPHDQERLRFVTFLTDGYIGNDAEILKAVDDKLGAARIFSFGVGSSPNRYLMERMASIGRGAVAYLSLEDSGGEIMGAFFDRIAHPAMIDVDIDWGSMAVSDVYPSRLPDLFVGRPIIVTGKFTGRPNDLSLRGRAAGERVAVGLEYDRRAPEHEFLPNLWARLKIAELNDRLTVSPGNAGPLGRQIRETALAYNLMSDYTSFIAVDASQVTSGRSGTTVYQAVPVPDGVSYETAVGR